jgi:DNA invertase Pin-like site-specific DNA recombinase
MRKKSKDLQAPRTWAYLRVSTDAQDVDNQRLEVLDLAKRLNLGAVEFVEDNAVSGTIPWRQRALGDLMDRMGGGDALVVAELSRLGRSMLEIMEILAEATRREIRIYAVKGGWTLDGSLQSKIVAMVLAMAAEIERDLLVQRTRAALETRKALVAAGKTWTSKSGRVVDRLGRPSGPGASKLDPHAGEIRELLALGVPQTKVAAKFKTTARNIRHWLAMRDRDQAGD